MFEFFYICSIEYPLCLSLLFGVLLTAAYKQEISKLLLVMLVDPVFGLVFFDWV